MDRALTLGRSGPSGLILTFLGLLPLAMVLHDGILAPAPLEAIWSMPMPVAAALLVLTGAGLAAGRGAAGASADPAARRLALAALALALLAAALTALRAGHPLYGYVRLAELGLCAGTALALAAAIRAEGPGFGRRAALALVFGTALALAPMAAARAAGWPAGFGPLDLPGFTHIRILGFSLALALAAATGLWAGETGRGRALLFAAMAAMAAALFWSGGRGALAALALPLPVLALVVRPLRPGLAALCAALLLGVLAAGLLPGGAAEFGLFGRLAGSAGSASADALSSGRLAIWRTLFAATAEAPFLGHGAAQTHWILAASGEHKVAHVHAHNLVLDAALALGWPGTALAGLLAAIAWLRWLLRARASGDALHAAGLATVTAFVVFALVDGVYVYWQGLLPLALGVALLGAPPAVAGAPRPR